MTIEWIDIWKLLAAMAGGALIGLEREVHSKPAGFRTNIMICLGSALFTVLSVRLAEGGVADRARIAAQIVTGVGFLGAGAIIHLRRHVVGLTTAATIWVVASVGMAFGAGAFALGAVGTVLTTAVLFGLGYAEKRLEEWRTVGRIDLELAPGADAAEIVGRRATDAGVRCKSLRLSKTPEGVVARVKVVGSKRGLEDFCRGLLRQSEVRAVKR